MSVETLEPQTEIRPPAPEAPPEPAATSPIVPEAYYELNEQEIRDKVTAAYTKAEQQKAEGIAAGSVKKAPVVVYFGGDVSIESGQIADIDKARVMAEAERPYRDEIFARGLNNPASKLMRNPDTLWSILREPINFGKAFGRSAAREILELRALSASTVAGINFDKIIEATQPYRPEVVVTKAIQEVVNFLEPEPEPEPEHGARAEAASGPAATSEKTPALTEALNVPGQYAEQLQILYNSKLIERLDDGRFGYTNEHQSGEQRNVAVPNREQVETLINEKAAIVREKANQGFTRLLLVPNGLSKERLAAALNDSIASHVEANNLHDATGVPIQAKQYGMDPRNTDFVKQTDRLKELRDRDSDDKKSDTASGIPGWDILLVKNMPEAPQDDAEVVAMGGRGEFKATYRTPKYTKKIMETDPRLHNESGFNFSTWLTYALTEMERTGTAVDYRGGAMILDSFGPYGLFGKGEETAWVGWRKRYSKGRTSPMQLKWGTVPPKYELHAGVRTAVRLN